MRLSIVTVIPLLGRKISSGNPRFSSNVIVD
uniref:Uncharacterized protein n=1 Tax=Heterorhabditis bacteriophora TaxID=37862 RepID=A0A1I7WVC9_HETBA